MQARGPAAESSSQASCPFERMRLISTLHWRAGSGERGAGISFSSHLKSSSRLCAKLSKPLGPVAHY